MPKFNLEGGGSVRLTDSNYITTGGEGSIYAIKDMAFKIYTDPTKMIPIQKIKELQTIKDPDVIIPQRVLFDGNNTPAGYCMRFVNDTYQLCEIFPKAFRDRNNISPNDIVRLVKQIQEKIRRIHQQGILLVDINELNFLTSKDLKTAFFIDTDSYKTRSYPATAIMDYVRDRHSPVFSEMTDWFSFGILSFQLFTGIHPYKGKFPGVKTVDKRMKSNISVLHQGVRVPKATLPFDVIPDVYMRWYRAVFEDGARVPPPFEDTQQINVTMRITKISGTNNFIITELYDAGEPILLARSFYNSTVYLVKKAVIVDKLRKPLPFSISDMVYAANNNRWIAAGLHKGKLLLHDITNNVPVNIDTYADEVMTYNNTLYVKSGPRILEVAFSGTGSKLLPTTKIVANVLPLATRLYEGVVVQNMLGRMHITIFPKNGITFTIPVSSLDKSRIINAKFDNHVLIITAINAAKTYVKYTLRFNSDYSDYTEEVNNTIQTTDVNFVVTSTGIAAEIPEDDRLNLFSNNPITQDIKSIKDAVIDENMRLMFSSAGVEFIKGNKHYSLKMR